MQILSIEAEEFQHQYTVSEINKMQIISVNERTFSLAQSYLLPIEQKCVFLSQLVRKHSPDIYIILDNNPDNSNNSDKSSQLINLQNILGVFYLNKSLFHCFKDTSKVNIADFTPLFYQILTQNQASIKNISGEKDGTDFFLEVIRNLSENPDSTFTKKFNVKQINDYKLMVLPHQQFQDSQKLYNDDFIMRCTENDMENLFEIERNYLQDEVAVRGQKVSDAEVSMRLRQILKNQLYFALISDDRIVSKAYTNAIGKNWIQIGGVYTLFQFRQNGYAALTVSTLCKRILQAHKNISLFVKTKNLPAQQLYKKIGFSFHSDYKIVYFEL
ncbi:MAG: GNAT family N-acetyltransferase [Spirochaetales bacterium]|nr:GNAT family N-acetyltransferase [Spirochaetales bacterium]MDY5916093.1 GNAT family N-acetyltransferase [Treponema sp.]